MNKTKRLYITFACCYIIAMGLFARNMSAKSFFAHAIDSKENVSILNDADNHNQYQQNIIAK